MYIEHVDEAVSYINQNIGNEWIVAAPLGLGKPNQLLNAIYDYAKNNPTIRLTILTALSLEPPTPGNGIEGALAKPIIDKWYGDYCKLDYYIDLKKEQLPDNITVHEFYVQAGSIKQNAYAQQQYISSNYTHISRDTLFRNVNVVVQLVSEDRESGQLSLSCNTDISLELLPKLKECGRSVVKLAQIHADLPFMHNNAIVPPDTFDLIIKNCSAETFPEEFIRALILIKQSAAQANQAVGVISQPIANAIQRACEHLLKNDNIIDAFPVPIFQTGSGTSTHMNVNEVLARLAEFELGAPVHPNDHVNAGQSSNDVFPTAIHISAALYLSSHLLPTLSDAIQTIQQKATTLQGIIKTGRTHLMDAMPIPFTAALNSWAEQLNVIKHSLVEFKPKIATLAQGGTAVGTGINSHPQFQFEFFQALNEKTPITFTGPNSGVYHLISGQETSTLLSGQCKTLAVALIKIANDLRWMSSGPFNGLSEISLKPLQPGSSIMPGKVNPVIPEAVIMACYQVIGYDTAITLCAQSGQFELNVSLPLIASNLLKSMYLVTNSLSALTHQAIVSFNVNEERLSQSLERNPLLATALNGRIGYDQVALMTKRALQENRSIIDVAEELTDLKRETLQEILDPKNMIQPQVNSSPQMP